jgi:dolichol-phosphate mannosyltransferase
MPPAAWIVLPTLCEAANVGPVIGALLAVAPAGTRILVVDDASPDGTGAVADRLAATHDTVAVLHREGPRGLGASYVDGFAHALAHGAGTIVQMDCDGSHDPAVVPALLAALAHGADLAIGSRYVAGGGVAGWGAGRRLVSRAGCAYARAVLGAPVRDLTSGFKAWRADALAATAFAGSRARGYAFQVELTWRALRAGLAVVELPIVFGARRAGRSKLSRSVALEAAWRVPALRLQSRRPPADPTV